MHAGEMKNGRGQRANGGKIPAGRFETSKPEEKGEEKCTPARRRKVVASVHTEANCTPASSRCSSRRRNGKKNARRRGGEQQGPACKQRQNPRRQIRDAQARGEMGRKMHAGEARKGRGQRAHRGKIHAGGQSSNICRGRSFFRQPPVFPIERLPNQRTERLSDWLAGFLDFILFFYIIDR